MLKIRMGEGEDKGWGSGWDITIIEGYLADVLGKPVLYLNESCCTTIK